MSFVTVTDHLGRKISIPGVPKRIVSLCPSQTETLFHLGLGEEVVGRTRFCIHPEPQVKEVVQVGGTKEVKPERIAELNPDLIIGEKEENTPEMVRELSQHWPVYITDVTDIPSALQMIRDLGSITGKAEEGTQLASQIETAFSEIDQYLKGIRVLYFIWRTPYMVAGGNTFIGSVLDLLGAINPAAKGKERYPEILPEEISSAKPELILLSSEPYPFQEKHLKELEEIAPNAKILLVDGEMFTWYGSRMLMAPAYLKKVLGPIREEMP